MNEIKTTMFEGASVDWIDCPDLDHGAGVSAATLARMLGTTRQNIAKAVRQHADQFSATETRVNQELTQPGLRRAARLFSPIGCLRLCRYVKTERTDDVFNFMLKIAAPVMDGSATLATPDQIAAVYERGRTAGISEGIQQAALQIESRLEAKYASKFQLQQTVLEQLAEREADRLVNSARDLANAKKSPIVRAVADETRRLADERRGQRPLFAHLAAEELAALKDRIGTAVLVENMRLVEAGKPPMRYSVRAVARLVERNRRHVSVALSSMLYEGSLAVRDGRVTVPSRGVEAVGANRLPQNGSAQ